jgi:phage-related minor tail protein
MLRDSNKKNVAQQEEKVKEKVKLAEKKVSTTENELKRLKQRIAFLENELQGPKKELEEIEKRKALVEEGFLSEEAKLEALLAAHAKHAEEIQKRVLKRLQELIKVATSV